MDRTSTLYCIATCLEYTDLARLSQVNRLCRTVATREDLWRAESIRICAVSSDVFQVIDVSGVSVSRLQGRNWYWRDLLMRVIKVSLLWKDLLGTADAGVRAGIHVADILRRPEIPYPRLCREGSTYSTSSQQLFADVLNGSDLPTRCEDLAGLEWMDARADTLFAEVAGHIEEELLLKARWVLKAPALPFKHTQAAILRFYSCVKKTIQTHCHLVCAMLDEAGSLDALLVQYCTQWAAFSAACTHLEADFRGFTSMLNDMYEAKFPTRCSLPRFSMTKLMTILWRRVVFHYLQADLLKAAELAIAQAHSEAKARDKVQVFAQALVDLSVDEYTIHMLQHSKVQLDGPYNTLQEVVLADISGRIKNISDVDKCVEVYNEEMELAEQLYLPVTCRLISELLAEKELDLLIAHFQLLVRSLVWRAQVPNTEDSLPLNSSFGLFCFNLLNHQKQLVVQFLSWAYPTEATKIALFNDLSGVKDLLLFEDEWIERKAGRLFRLPVSIPSAFRSTAHDLKRTDLSPGLQHCLA